MVATSWMEDEVQYLKLSYGLVVTVQEIIGALVREGWRITVAGHRVFRDAPLD